MTSARQYKKNREICSKLSATVKVIMRKKSSQYTVGVRVVPEPELGNSLTQLYDALLSDARLDKPKLTGDISGEEPEQPELQDTRRPI